MTNANRGYMLPFACFVCRKSFKRTGGVLERPCPLCGGVAVPLNRKFKPPLADDVKQWGKVRYLYEHGFRFQSIYDEHGNAVPYPETPAEVERFMKCYQDQAMRGLPGVAIRIRPKRKG